MSEPREPYNETFREAASHPLPNLPAGFYYISTPFIRPVYKGLGAKRRLLMKAGLLDG